MGEHVLPGVGALPVTAPAELRGRAAETATLADGLRSRDVRQVVVVGAAGVGKTALVCRVLQDRLTSGELAGVVHLGRVGDLPTGFPQLLHGLGRFLPAADATRIAGRLRWAQETPTALVAAVLDALPAGRVVVLLDGAEELVTEAGAIADAALEEALRALLTGPASGVTVVVTTRVPPGPLLAPRPDRQRRIDLTGLAPAAAAELLRDRDPDGGLGLRDAPAHALIRAATRAGGNPRALEALAAALDPEVGLPALLDRIGARPDDRPDDLAAQLVGEALAGLDPLVRQVVEALAVFPRPVPAAVVDGVLHAFHPEADSAPALRLLESRRLVRSAAGCYGLHPADRDVLLDRLPEGGPSDLDADPPPFTLSGLRQLAANQLAAASGAPASWTSVDDLGAPLAEFDLRCTNGDFDGAARVLVRGVWDRLRSWGHLRLTLALLTRLPERVGEPRLNGWCVSALASCYAALGQPNRAVELHERARMICVRTTDLAGEATEIGNLGRCHAELGDLRRAARLHDRARGMFHQVGDLAAATDQLLDLAWCQVELGRPEEAVTLLDRTLARPEDALDRATRVDALALAGTAHRENGDLGRAVELHVQGLDLATSPRGEATHAGLLGVCRARTGRVGEARELHRRALGLDRAVGHRGAEALELARLAGCDVLDEELAPAVELTERALAIARETGDFRLQADCLVGLGWCLLHLGSEDRALRHYEQAAELAASTGSAGTQAAAHLGLARAHLWAGRPGPAERAVRDAARHPHPPAEPEIALLSGAIDLRRGDDLQASGHFARTVALATRWLERSPDHVDVAVLDLRALAHAGLTLSHLEPDTAAVADFRAARAASSAAGVVSWVLRWLDNLTPPDHPDALDALRPAAAGREPTAHA